MKPPLMHMAPMVLAILLAAMVGGCANTAPLNVQADALVDKARWTVENFKTRENDEPAKVFRKLMPSAHAVVILPQVLKAGFVIGGEGGNGVMLVRDAGATTWGYPAFYTLAGGSFGLQIGAQTSDMVIIVRSPAALKSLLEHQGQVGADVGVAVGTIGGGVEGATTTNLGADIVVVSLSKGLFGGLSVKGGVLARRNDLNEVFYGAGATPEAILMERRFANRKADALRGALKF